MAKAKKATKTRGKSLGDPTHSGRMSIEEAREIDKQRALKAVESKKVDNKKINELINVSVDYLVRGMKGRAFNKKEKTEIAKSIAVKSVPKDLHIGDKDGESLVALMKEMSKPPKQANRFSEN